MNSQRKYYLKNKDLLLNKQKENIKQFPWKYTLKHIKQRCYNKKATGYHNYGGRGIKCLITEEELKKLWFRDKAYNMKKPTIERKNNDGHYEYNNCEYIEKSLNSKRSIKNPKRKRTVKPILQYSLQGKFIKKWDSLILAAKELQIMRQGITHCLSNRNKSAGNYIWKYYTKNQIKNLTNSELLKHKNTSKKPILQYSLDRKFIREWNSILEAQKSFYTKGSNIMSALKNKKNQKTAYGFIWKYKI